MIRSRYVHRPVVLFGVFLCLCGGFGIELAHAQLTPSPNALQKEEANVSVNLTLRGVRMSPGWTTPDRERGDSLRVGRALVGSTIGVGAGVGIGLLLLKGAAEGSPDEEADNWREQQASDAAGMMTLIGVAAMAAGGPIGAVKGGGIERNRRDAYVGAGVGEFVGGILGLVLAGQIHDSTPSRLIGLGMGMAVGAAAGAVWVASAQKTQREDGLFSYQKGRWQLSAPDVQVRPHLTTNRLPSVGVTVISATF